MGAWQPGTGTVDKSAEILTGASFWDLVSLPAADERAYESLADLTAASDAVVAGRVTSIRPGRTFVVNEALVDDHVFGSEAYARFAEAEVVVDEILSGQVDHADKGRLILEVFLPPPMDVADLSELPTASSVFFVHFKLDKGNDRYYRLLNMSQSAFENVDGRVRLPTSAHGGWIDEWEDAPFDALLAAVRELSW